VQILTENNTEESKTSPQTAIEITILRSKIGIKILQGNWRGIYRHNFRYKRKNGKKLKVIENHSK